MVARTGCPPVPFFLRHNSCNHPSKLVASQPRPTAGPMVSLFPPLNDAGAPAGAGVEAGVGVGETAAAADVVAAGVVLFRDAPQDFSRDVAWAALGALAGSQTYAAITRRH